MPEATATATPKAKKTAAPKNAAPATKPTKKAAAAAAPAEKKAPAPRAKKEGLRAPQERILKTLLAGESTRKQLAEKATFDVTMGTEYLGSSDDEVRIKNDTKHFPSLISLGFVKAEEHEDSEGRKQTFYKITAEGKKAAAKIKVEE